MEVMYAKNMHHTQLDHVEFHQCISRIAVSILIVTIK